MDSRSGGDDKALDPAALHSGRRRPRLGVALGTISALAVAGSVGLLVAFGIVAAALAAIASIVLLYGLILILLPRRTTPTSVAAGPTADTPIRQPDRTALRHR